MAEKEIQIRNLRLRSNAETLKRFAEAFEAGRLERSYEILQEAGTTSDFPVLMGNGLNRVLQASYRAVPSYWQGITRQGTIADFREKKIIRLSESDDLQEIPERGEFRDSSLTEEQETTKLVKYGRKFSVSWETIVNDDLDAIKRQPERFGRSAGRLINRLVFQGVLEGNPNMSDGNALFSAAHGNLGGAALSETSLQAAITALRRQKDPKGQEIAVLTSKPFLVVPAELEFTAKKLVNASLNPGTNIGDAILADVNTLRGIAEPLVVEFLTDPNDWYLIANPLDIDTIQVDFLRQIGQQPQLFMRDTDWLYVGGGAASAQEFDAEYLVRHVVTAKAVDWRGMYKSTVA